MAMKKLFLTGIATLFLATGTTHAEENRWGTDFRHCVLTKTFNTTDPYPYYEDFHDGRIVIGIDCDEILEIVNGIKELKKCAAFWQCVEDREKGKVKHCDENDRRWR